MSMMDGEGRLEKRDRSISGDVNGGGINIEVGSGGKSFVTKGSVGKRGGGEEPGGGKKGEGRRSRSQMKVRITLVGAEKARARGWKERRGLVGVVSSRIQRSFFRGARVGLDIPVKKYGSITCRRVCGYWGCRLNGGPKTVVMEGARIRFNISGC